MNKVENKLALLGYRRRTNDLGVHWYKWNNGVELVIILSKTGNVIAKGVFVPYDPIESQEDINEIQNGYNLLIKDIKELEKCQN